jgi:16S rRNA (cytidine1402-2'-O)-methyltransferase
VYSRLDAALYLVPTPIGNLDDITKRAFHILSLADIIACEDTRTSGNLLKHLRISPKKLISLHEHNEYKKSNEIISEISAGKSVALISDAGSPGLSDPGNHLINECYAGNLKVIPLPGANALIPAVTASGLIKNEFLFAGFLPNQKGRKKLLSKYINMGIDVVFYESPHRLIKLINEIESLTDDDLNICIAREISKIHEEFIRGTLSQVKSNLEERDSIKGEIVVILKAKNKEE